MKRLTTFFAVVLAAAASSTAVARSDASCSGAQLKGTFSVVRGSAGAGNITYKLTLRNVSTRMCTVTGLPQGRLLGKTGKALPTHVKAAFPGGLTAIFVRLAPGATTFATARFSPDVPVWVSRRPALSASRPRGRSASPARAAGRRWSSSRRRRPSASTGDCSSPLTASRAS